MSEFATCPDCDQKVTAKPGKSSGKCPACGAAVSFAKASAGKSSRRSKDDEDEDDDRKPAKAKPKRKYRKEWDDDDDDDDRRKAPPKQGGSLLWLWILLGVLALVVASCAGMFFFVWNVGKTARDNIVDRNEQLRREIEDEQRRVLAAQGKQNIFDTNRPGKGPAPLQSDAKTYPDTKPAGGDPAMAGGGPIYLDQLQPFKVTQGPYKFGRGGALGSPENNWVVVKGTFYDHSIAMVPPDRGVARANFAVDGQARTLSGSVALSDLWHKGDAWGEVTFTIYKDGKQIWQSKPRKSTQIAAEAFNLDITGARVIMLETKATDSSHDAHAVWLDPVLTK